MERMTTPILALCLSLPPILQDAPPSLTIGDHSGPILAIALSPDGKTLYTAARKELHAWELGKGESLWKKAIQDAPIFGLGAGEELVACLQGEGWVNFYSAETGEAREAAMTPHGLRRAECLALDPGDQWAWLGFDGAVTRVVPSSVQSWSNRKMENGGTTCFALDAKGKQLAVGGKDGTVRFVGAKSANVDDKKVFEGHAEPLSALALDAKGSIVVSGAEDGELRVWKVSSGKCRAVLKRHGNRIEHVACEPKGKRFASGDSTGSVLLWKLGSDDPPVEILAPSGEPVTGLAFTDNGKTLVTSGGSGRVTLWDVSKL